MNAVARVKVRQGENAFIAASVRYANEGQPTVAELTEIQLRVFDLDKDRNEPVYADSLPPGDHFLDEGEELSDGWPGLGTYNFHDWLPGGDFEMLGGHTYLAQYELVFGAADPPGSVFVMAEVEVLVVK